MPAGWAPETRSHYLQKQKSYQQLAAATAPTAREHLLPPHLESLVILNCAGMLGGTLRLPAPLKELRIMGNSGLTSLECLSGEHPPSLEILLLERCSTLASLPNEPQVYRSLYFLRIRGCPAIKKLPRCLRQRLGSLDYKELDAQHEGMLAARPSIFATFNKQMQSSIP